MSTKGDLSAVWGPLIKRTRKSSLATYDAPPPKFSCQTLSSSAIQSSWGKCNSLWQGPAINFAPPLLISPSLALLTQCLCSQLKTRDGTKCFPLNRSLYTLYNSFPSHWSSLTIPPNIHITPTHTLTQILPIAQCTHWAVTSGEPRFSCLLLSSFDKDLEKRAYGHLKS